jgi:hypothetical protein
MVRLDRNGANLLHASLADSGKDSIQAVYNLYDNDDYDNDNDDAQPDLHVRLLLWPYRGVWMSESE